MARNEFSMNEPDNSGRLLDSGEIVKGAPETILTTAPVHVIDEEFEHDEHICWSEDAGGYVCNETIYRTLYAMQDREKTPLPALFVHLPPEDEISLDAQVEAVRRIATCLVCRPTYEVVGGLLFDAKDRILACKRPQGDAWAGWWEFPGGKIEAGEDPNTALIRELIEEIGVSTQPKSMVEQISHEYDDRSVKLQIWDCGVIDPDSIRLIEHDEIRWLSVDELLDVKWLPADLPIIERWKREGIPRT
jgi:8-oxo-dGTP diphosphatase